MSRFAKFLMLLALTLQGFMPAMAMAMHTMAQESVVDAGMKAHHDHGASQAGHQQSQMQIKWQCPLSPTGCNVGFCIACTALPPYVAAEQSRPTIPGTPAPGLMAPMADAGLQPLVPPPRA